MSCILHIETSTEVCSVAVSQDGASIFSKEDFNGPSHATVLGVFVDEALSFIDNHAIPLDAVAVSCGPGSYTGLRIGVSMAKGICYGRNIPLIGLPTLEVMCVPVLLAHDLPEDALLCPMIDARRMEVYAAVYDRALKVQRAIGADIIDENSYAEYLEKHPVYFFGNGAAKCKEKLSHPNAHFIENIHPVAKWMFPLAEKAMAVEDFKDVAYFEPFYLKEFVACAIGADIIDENSYAEYLEKHPVYFFGNGAAKCKEKLSHPNAHFIENIHPVAKWMFPLAEKAMAVEDFKDVAYFEPFYLKEFVASTPKKLL
jgi:tRNA threonylcarbamoyladenosine biosynthesis protein TsaB